MATLLGAAFMELLDVTIVNVAIPTLRQDLHMSYAAIQWMAAGYTLSFAIFLVAGGRLGDIFGRKKIFISGVVWFTAASLLCGVAGTGEQLVAFRLLQGIGAALMMPQIMANLVVLFHSGKERLAASGMYGGVAGLATVSGPIVGGLLLEHSIFGLSWRSIFLINVPVGIITLCLALKYVPESRSSHALKVDWIGMTLLGAALFVLLYPLIQGRELGWPAWSLWMMASSLPLLGAFWWWERIKEKRDGSPLVVLELFQERTFVAGIILFTAFYGAMTSFFFLFTLFLQGGLGFSPLHAGLNNAPISVGIAISAGALVNVLLPKIGRSILVLGSLGMTLGYVWIYLVLGWFGIEVTSWQLLPGLLLFGLGLGMFIASLFNFVLAGIAHNHAGSASGVFSTVQELGSAAGIALIGVLFFSILGSNALPSAQQQSAMIYDKLRPLHLPSAAEHTIVRSFTTCFVDRSSAKDPGTEPKSCKQTKDSLPPQVANAITHTLTEVGATANKHNFVDTFRTTLLYMIGVSMVVLALIPLLPKKVSNEIPEEALAI